MVVFKCQYCGKSLSVKDEFGGSPVRCPACSGVSTAPATDGAGRPEPEAPPVQHDDGDISFHFSSGLNEEESLDMTPMVDVTFLLLIFFMVTAAFDLQKSLEVPPPDQQEEAAQTQTLEELETDTDFVIVRIDSDGYITVDGEDAPSKPELVAKLREAKEGNLAGTGTGPSGMMVLADGDARHEAIVMALDAGNAVGMERIRLSTLDESEL